MKINTLAGKKCEICGKIIFPTSNWVYKIIVKNKQKKYYCSYTCFTKGKSEMYKAKPRKRKTFRWRNGEM